MTWHRQAAFQILYEIFQMNSNEVKQTEQDVLNPSKKNPNWVIYPP